MDRSARFLLSTAAALVAATAVTRGSADAPPRIAAPERPAAAVARDADGLFRVVARINGAPVRLVVDTGASTVVLSPADARRVGIGGDAGRPDRLETAAGRVAVRRVRLDRLEVGRHRIGGADAIVADGTATSLLGQDALARLGTVTLRRDRLEWE